MNNHHWNVVLPATYCTEWQDGYGVRGWKLDVALNDPAVIASTEETGARIPTSVFVHDIVDHHLCGLAMSGHRNEAIALNLLSERTGSSPIPDYTQMTEEDILPGQINGEPMKSFLPDSLVQEAPESIRNDNIALIQYLAARLGRKQLKELLIRHFEALGKMGYANAREAWIKTGLDFQRRKQIGSCIQELLEQSRPFLIKTSPEILHAEFRLSNDRCCLAISETGKEYYCAT
ncbi:MAG: hypothetical protein R3312_09975 [Gammaproteobacteria bacterium]|nr:hypothetical protein [Gammaproteobacteria bacterium]